MAVTYEHHLLPEECLLIAFDVEAMVGRQVPLRD